MPVAINTTGIFVIFYPLVVKQPVKSSLARTYSTAIGVGHVVIYLVVITTVVTTELSCLSIPIGFSTNESNNLITTVSYCFFVHVLFCFVLLITDVAQLSRSIFDLLDDLIGSRRNLNG